MSLVTQSHKSCRAADMLNFTAGPVQMDSYVRELGAQQIPYFRTPEFSSVMKENESDIKKLAKAEENARVLFLTGSGTAAMEAAVMNVFSGKDNVLVINGGSFGERFVRICRIHRIPYTELKLAAFEGLTGERLSHFAKKGYTGLLVNMHETSTGVLYDMEMIQRFCRENHLFFVVDAVSSFLADPIFMEKWNADVLITGSQKALACPPGISVIVLSDRAVKRIGKAETPSLYFDLKMALEDAERGQTPFTPAVGILLQIHARLQQLRRAGGAESEIQKTAALAQDFRRRIADFPFEIPSADLSNAVTPLRTRQARARRIFEVLKDEYGIWVCPNGGCLADQVFRVGHLGNLTIEDNKKLICALLNMQERGLL